jgi:hypothetical protein
VGGAPEYRGRSFKWTLGGVDARNVFRDQSMQGSLETRIGLLASTQDHTHVDRRTLAGIPGLILATSPQPIVINIVATVFNEITAVTFALTQ